MSRVSSKSSLSPSSSGIDTSKSGDTGGKTQTSVSTGGIGVTREVANIGGLSVTGGVAVELSPVRFDISGNPNYEDPTKSAISIGAGAEVPGGLLGVSGGVTINTSTGAIEEISIGGEVAAFGVNVSADSDGNIGFELTFQIPFTPIELSLGFGPSKNKKPRSTPLPPPSSSPNDGSFKSGEVPPFNPKCFYSVSILCLGHGTEFVDCIGYGFNESSQGFSFKSSRPAPGVYGSFGKRTKHPWRNYYVYQIDMFPDPPVGFVEIRQLGGSRPVAKGDLIKGAGPWYKDDAPKLGTNVTTYGAAFYSDYWTSYHNLNAAQATNFCATFMNQSPMRGFADYRIKIDQQCPGDPDLMVVVPNDLFLSLPSPPFPNPPPRKEKMDECCRENLKLLRAIHKGLGIAKFPGKMPSTIIQTIPKKGERPAEPPLEPVGDWVDLFMWNFKRDDERWGQWEIQIDVKDSDLTKEGDQGKSIKFPNLAESVAEIEGQILSLLTNVEALVAIQTKCLVESGMARQEAIKGYLASKAIIKYMAFKSTEIDVSVPMTFTAGAESISDLIKESEGHIKGTDYTEKETLRDILLDLLQAAAVIRAVHWQKIDTKTDTKSQLLGLLKGSVDLANTLTKPQSTAEDSDGNKFDPAQDFEDFIDSVEDGFTNSTGITDIQNPYGKSRDRRPRIRQIGDNISQAGGNK